MHLTALEEYGLRCLLQVARKESEELLTIQDIAASEGISPQYAAKLMRVLRQGNLVESTRGAAGGYRLARPADTITIWEVLNVLGGPLFTEDFCDDHTGILHDCVHSTDCSVRALWGWVAEAVEQLLGNVTVGDLTRRECRMVDWLSRLPLSTPGSGRPRGE